MAGKTYDPILRRTWQEMGTRYHLLAQLAAAPPPDEDHTRPRRERQSAPFYGALIDGSDHRH